MLLYSRTLAYPRTVSPYVSVSPYISVRSLPLHKSCCSRFFYCQLVNLVASQLIPLPVNFIVSYSYISISRYSVFTETRVHLPPRETAARYSFTPSYGMMAFRRGETIIRKCGLITLSTRPMTSCRVILQMQFTCLAIHQEDDVNCVLR